MLCLSENQIPGRLVYGIVGIQLCKRSRHIKDYDTGYVGILYTPIPVGPPIFKGKEVRCMA